MKLNFRFLVLVGALLGAVAASATAGWVALGQLDSALTGVVSGDMERLLAITHTRRLFRSMVVLERDYLLAKSPEERQQMEAKMTKSAGELLEQIEKYRRLMPSEDKVAVDNILAVRGRWIALDEQVRAAANRGEPGALALAAQHDADPISWEGVIGGLVKASEARLAKQADAAHGRFRDARSLLLWVSGGAALLAAGLGSAIFLGIRRNVLAVQEVNENLEHLVRVRTEALTMRERSLRLILDNTGDGIIGLRADGALTGVASAAAQRWFGNAVAGTSAAKYLFPSDSGGELYFTIAIEQMLEGVLPWEVVVAQAPRSVRREGRILELNYQAVTDPTDDIHLLVMARDVTARVDSEQAEQAAREQHGLVSRLLADKQGFASFVRDTEDLLQRLTAESDPVAARRYLHTLKGNVSLFGLASMGTRCHQIEDRLESNDLPSVAEIADLNELFRAKLKGIEDFLQSVGRPIFELQPDDHTALIQSLIERKDYRDILKMVETWSWSKTSEQLTRLRAQAEHVGNRLNKPLQIDVEHNGLRIPSDYLVRFWPTLVHVIRNAVDHGVEPQDARVASGKPPTGRISLRTSQTNDAFIIEIADDGGGINEEAVRRSAASRGVAAAATASLTDLIFMDGLSTRGEVTELSGRGVGLSAAREECLREGGQLSVSTEPGKGTSFTFRFRRPVVKADDLTTIFERRWSLAPLSSTQTGQVQTPPTESRRTG